MDKLKNKNANVAKSTDPTAPATKPMPSPATKPMPQQNINDVNAQKANQKTAKLSKHAKKIADLKANANLDNPNAFQDYNVENRKFKNAKKLHEKAKAELEQAKKNNTPYKKGLQKIAKKKLSAAKKRMDTAKAKADIQKKAFSKLTQKNKDVRKADKAAKVATKKTKNLKSSQTLRNQSSFIQDNHLKKKIANMNAFFT